MKSKIDKNKWLILFTIGIIFLLSIFTLSVYELTKSRNIGFDSYEMFVGDGYKDIENIAKNKQEEYDQYINTNRDRIDSYNIDFDSIISDVEQDNYDSVNLLNEVEVDNYKLYKEDVQTIIKQELLELNIQAYEMIQSDEYEGREELYSKLKNLEILYDSFIYDIPIDEVNIGDTAGMNLIKEDITLWGKEINKGVVNIVLFIYLIIVIGIIIYLIGKKKRIRLLVIFTVVLFSSVFIYRKIESNYYPTYIKINKLVGVNTNTKGEYFINFIPIVVANTFEENGGDFNTYKDMDGNIQEVDWPDETSVNKWIDSEYLGNANDGNPNDNDPYTNGERLENIRSELESNNYDGYDKIGGWDFNPQE